MLLPQRGRSPVLLPLHTEQLQVESPYIILSVLTDLSVDPCTEYQKYWLESKYLLNALLISRFECGLKLAEQELSCIPWYLPQVRSLGLLIHVSFIKGENSSACDPWTAKNFTKVFSKKEADRCKKY